MAGIWEYQDPGPALLCCFEVKWLIIFNVSGAPVISILVFSMLLFLLCRHKVLEEMKTRNN